MGVVYEATHTALNKKVALKALHAELAKEGEALQRFLREGRSASRIRHPNVVDVTDVRISQDIAYLVMELLDGHSLSQELKGAPPLSEERAAELLLPVAHALAEAHREGIVHRDLKPGNIFLSRTHTAQLVPNVLDFGICRVLDDDAGQGVLTRTDAAIGTPAFMSPEQARGERNIDGQSDQYSLGVVLYLCVTGINPFSSEDCSVLEVIHAITRGELVPPREHNEAVSAELEAVILKAMALDKADRYSSMDEMGRALLPFVSEHVRVVWGAAFSRDSSQLGHRAPDAPSSLPTVSSLGVPPGRGISQTVLAPVAGVGATPATTKLTITQHLSTPPPQLRASRLAAAGLVVAVIGVAALSYIRSGTEPRTTVDEAAAQPTDAQPQHDAAITAKSIEARDDTYEVKIRTEPATASVSFDGKWVGVGRFAATLVRGEQHLLLVQAEGHQSRVVELRGPPTPTSITLEPAPATATPATATPATAPAGERPPTPPSKSLRPRSKTDNIDPWGD